MSVLCEARKWGAIISSQPGVLVGRKLSDTDVCELVLRQFGV